MNTFTIEELIRKLQAIEKKYGPHIEVLKRTADSDDGKHVRMPINFVTVANTAIDSKHSYFTVEI